MRLCQEQKRKYVNYCRQEHPIRADFTDAATGGAGAMGRLPPSAAISERIVQL